MKYLFNAPKFIDNHRFLVRGMETSVLEVLKRWNGHFVDLFDPHTATIILGYVITCDDCDLVNDDGSAIDTIKMPKIDMPTNNQQDCVDFQKSDIIDGVLSSNKNIDKVRKVFVLDSAKMICRLKHEKKKISKKLIKQLKKYDDMIIFRENYYTERTTPNTILIHIEKERVFPGDCNIYIDFEDYKSICYELAKKEKSCERLTQSKNEYMNLWLRSKNEYDSLYISYIYHNSKKNTTCVVFADDTKIIVKRRKGDSDSVYTAVAYAITQKMYKTNNAFIKLVDKKVKEKI